MTQRTQKEELVKKEDRYSNIIIGAAIEVHRILGPGLMESAYKECLFLTSMLTL